MFLLTLLLCIAAPALGADTVLLFIGGRNDHIQVVEGSVTTYNTNLLSHVEILGCPASVLPAPYPTLVSGHGAVTSVAGSGLVCGGSTGLEDRVYTNFTQKCYFFDSEQNVWEETPEMDLAKTYHYMVETETQDEVLLMGGYEMFENNTRGDFDYSIQRGNNSGWFDTLGQLPNISINCMTVAFNKLYVISSRYRDNVTMEIDMDTWTATNISSGPFWTPDFCIPFVTPEGAPGIFSRYGEFLNLNTGEWRRSPVEYADYTGGAMTSYQGKPVKIGGWNCELESFSNYECKSVASVLQYQPETGNWTTLFELQYPRTLPLVAEVNATVCDFLPRAAPLITTIEPTSSDTPTTIRPEDSNVVMILGGRDDYYFKNGSMLNHSIELISHAELFGCPEPVNIPPYPTPISAHAAAVNVHGAALVCGGATGILNDLYSNFTNRCHKYSPSRNHWYDEFSMNDIRSHHHLFNVQLEDGTFPTVMGGYYEMENGTIGDFTTHFTSVYINSVEMLREDKGWEQLNFKLPNILISCITMVEDKIYVMSSNRKADHVTMIDPLDWSIKPVGSGPNWEPDYCIPYTWQGSPGIFTRQAEWFNLTSGEWTRIHQYASITGSAIATYEEKPTKFGGWKCRMMAGQVECNVVDEVVQYDVESDSWNLIGNLEQARTFPLVIPVPASLCHSPSTTTSDSTDPTTGATDSTTGATDFTTDVTDFTTDATDFTTDATDFTTDATDFTTDSNVSTTGATDFTTAATDSTTGATDSTTDSAATKTLNMNIFSYVNLCALIVINLYMN